MVSLSAYQIYGTYNVGRQLQWSNVICEQCFYCRVQLDGLLHDVDRDLLASFLSTLTRKFSAISFT